MGDPDLSGMLRLVDPVLGKVSTPDEECQYKNGVPLKVETLHGSKRNDYMSDSDSLAATYASFLTVRKVIVDPISSLSIMYFGYGFYVLLFGLCMRIMHARKREHVNQTLYLTLTIILFILSTLFVVDYTINIVGETILYFTAMKTANYDRLDEYLSGDLGRTIVFSFHQGITVLLNITADYMLIHRCYLIWDCRKRIAIPLIVASALVNGVSLPYMRFTPLIKRMSGLGISGTIVKAIGLRQTTNSANYALYLVGESKIAPVYSLSAGRIWYVHRQVTAVVGSSGGNPFLSSITRIILESGVICPLFHVGAIVTARTRPSDTFRFDFYPLAALSPGIASMLIIVRAKLGQNVETLDLEGISSIHFRSPQDDQTLSNGAAEETTNVLYVASSLFWPPLSLIHGVKHPARPRRFQDNPTDALKRDDETDEDWLRRLNPDGAPLHKMSMKFFRSLGDKTMESWLRCFHINLKKHTTGKSSTGHSTSSHGDREDGESSSEQDAPVSSASALEPFKSARNMRSANSAYNKKRLNAIFKEMENVWEAVVSLAEEGEAQVTSATRKGELAKEKNRQLRHDLEELGNSQADYELKIRDLELELVELQRKCDAQEAELTAARQQLEAYVVDNTELRARLEAVRANDEVMLAGLGCQFGKAIADFEQYPNTAKLIRDCRDLKARVQALASTKSKEKMALDGSDALVHGDTAHPAKRQRTE
ncbi:hypothetical protein VNI00_011254 [Paramarasmius palmivorus]|uniref:Uncharacterized protein n=1 Tax=Paramarasmius palmivorus TaxID=297713 RepID=A0AAW0CEN7_9AGAR